MRVRYSPIALLSLPALSIAVSLSDFPPAIQNLPSACGALYQQTISGCSSSDFTSKTGCSKSCIDALSAMTGPVQASCGNHNLGGENIIVAFLANSGPESICGNANAVLASESGSSPTSASAATSAAPATTSATSAPPSTTSSLQSTTSTTSVSSTSELSSSTVADTTSSAIAATTSTSTVTSTTASSSDASSTSAPSSTSSVGSSTTVVPVVGVSSTSITSSTSSSLNMDTSSPPATSSTGSATSTTSSKSNMQTNYNDGSGGGSPFDSAGNMAQSAGSRLSASAFGYAITVSFAACILALLR